MKPSENMETIVERIRYRVAGSTLLAHDCYWDGSNWERGGRNTYLYRSPKGLYFAAHLTQWQGERDSLDPLDPEAAYDLWERLREKEVEAGEAFPEVTVEEA